MSQRPRLEEGTGTVTVWLTSGVYPLEFQKCNTSSGVSLETPNFIRYCLTMNSPLMTVLDPTDRAILLELQRDSRQTYQEIGSHVNLAAASVHDRVKKLEKRGLITGYGAKVSPDALGLSTLAFIQIRLENHSNCMAVAPNFIQFPEVEECHSVAGDVDVILKVRSQNPHTLEQLLYRIKQVPGVVRTTTLVTLSTAFENQPIQALQPDVTP
jgi:Lrp/AsnC family transcriptional regulator, leucine-responsive regulatory protein